MPSFERDVRSGLESQWVGVAKCLLRLNRSVPRVHLGDLDQIGQLRQIGSTGNKPKVSWPNQFCQRAGPSYSDGLTYRDDLKGPAKRICEQHSP